MKNLLAITALAGAAIVVQAAPANAIQCGVAGPQACLNALDAFINSKSFVEAWANNAYQLYVTRNCPGGPSTTGTYTFWGRSVNVQEQLIDNLKPNVSCQECDARSRISGMVGDGYLGECSPTNDTSWTFVSHFCEPPGPQGAFVDLKGLTLYQAANYFLQCGIKPGVTTVSACSSAGGCLE